jgi:hypothetical protein
VVVSDADCAAVRLRSCVYTPHFKTPWICRSINVVILVGGYPFYPESPYYLLTKGQTSNAQTALLEIHGDSDQTLLDAELKRIGANVAFSKEVHAAAALKGPLLAQCSQRTNLVSIMFTHPLQSSSLR